MRRIIPTLLFIAFTLLISIEISKQTTIASAETDIFNPFTYLTTSADWYFESGQVGAELGYAVHTAGDVNGDGFDDIMIGSPLFEINGVTEGATFSFLGGGGGLHSYPDWQVSSGKQGSFFGSAVSTAGDVNGDGFDDVIIGAKEYKLPFDGYTGEPKSGAAFLYLGSDDGLIEEPNWFQPAEAAEIAFGFAVSSAGDVNNDGFDDVIIGAPFFESDPSQSNEGKVYMFLGSENGLSNLPDWTFECGQAGASCGYAVSSAGDINNDGFDDIIIGAPHFESPEIHEGAALVFLGSAMGLGLNAHRILEQDQAEAWFGEAVSSAGDVNGDGYDDVIIGASDFDRNEDQRDVGAAFLYLGSATGLDPMEDWIVYGSESNSGFGQSVHSAGDINRDGYADVLVGAHLFGQNGTIYQPDEGAVFIYTGCVSGLNTFSAWSAFGNKADAWFGFSAGAAGDVNGDGGMDVIVGAPRYRVDDKTVMGRSFVYLNTLEELNQQVFIPFIDK